MKLFKRLGAVMLAAVMTTGLAAGSVSAALPDSDRQEEAAITIHKYDMGDLDEDTLEFGDGTELTDDDIVIGKDTGAENVKLSELTKLANIRFTITQVKLKDGAEEGSDDPDDYEMIPSGHTESGVTDASGVLTFNDNGAGLPFGIYKVVEAAGDSVDTPVDPFLVRVPMTDPANGNNLLYDIHVYPKNKMVAGPEIDKEVWDDTDEPPAYGQESTYGLGDIVQWRISVDVPAGVAKAKKLEVNDTLDPRISFEDNAGDIIVSYSDKDGNEKELDVMDHYTYSYNSDSRLLNVKLTEKGLKELANALKGDDDETPIMYITFKTKVVAGSGQSVIDKDNPAGEFYNEAELDFTNENEMNYKPKSRKPKVKYGGLELLKIDGKDDSIALSGAKFKIYKSLSDAQEETNAMVNPAGGGEWEVTTDNNGKAMFYGLKYGTYWIVETQAPQDDNGKYYNLLDEPKEVTVSANSHTAPVEVKNYNGFTLPKTGGMGTMLFTAAGLLLIGAAGATLLASRKKKNT